MSFMTSVGAAVLHLLSVASAIVASIVAVAFFNYPVLNYTAPPPEGTSTPNTVTVPMGHTSLSSPSSFEEAGGPVKATTQSPIHKIAPALALTPLPVAPSASSSAPPAIAPDVLNLQTRGALVNILCTTQGGGSFEPITGSGVLIDSRGVVLTNAHVAQFFLLVNYPFPGNVNCLIRTGSPAKPAYTAELLYLPPLWIDANASKITSSTPTGTGENDYAFLLMTGGAGPDISLPPSFPYLSINDANPLPNELMLLASYPAGFLQGIVIQTNLYIASAYAAVGDLYVFNENDRWIDLFSVPGSVLSQGGSSGGAVVRASDGTLAGIIVSDTTAPSTAERDLRAITLSHIEHSLQNLGFTGIGGLLSGNLQEKATTFNHTIAPQLEQKLIDAL